MADPEDKRAERKLSPLEQAEERRENRKAQARKEYETQLALDLEAIDALEIAHGDSNVAVIRLPHTPGLPAAVAARCPKPGEMKRFRTQVTPRHEKDHPDTVAATELLAKSCLVHPDAETFDRLCAARPGLCTQLGKEVINLSLGREEAAGKG